MLEIKRHEDYIKIQEHDFGCNRNNPLPKSCGLNKFYRETYIGKAAEHKTIN